MKHKPGFGVLIFLFILIASKIASAQINSSKKDKIIDYIKSVYTTSDVLVNGVELLEGDPRINGHPYIFSEKWISSDIFIKGEVFQNKKIRYNLYTNQLMLQFHTEGGIQKGVVLDNKLVDSVLIESKTLVSTHLLGQKGLQKSFVEYFNAGKSVFYIEYNKDYIKIFTDSNPYGKYSSVKKNLYILRNDKLTNVSHRRHFLKIYPNHKKKIRRFLRKKGIKYKTATTAHLKQLIVFCNELD